MFGSRQKPEKHHLNAVIGSPIRCFGPPFETFAPHLFGK